MPCQGAEALFLEGFSILFAGIEYEHIEPNLAVQEEFEFERKGGGQGGGVVGTCPILRKSEWRD